MTCNILELLSKRHSFYDIDDKLPISTLEINALIQKCLEIYPSSFNAQSARLMVLYHQEHKKFWSLVENELLKVSPSEKADAIKKRISSFVSGAGTILFFDDANITKDLEKNMPLYAENFKNWAYQSNAILQYMIWTTFANYGIGSSLQHYNPLINLAVQQAFDISDNLELVAQMPFGGIGLYPQPHNFENIEKKLIVKNG